MPVLVPKLVGEVTRVGEGESATLTRVPLGEPAELTYVIRADFEGRAAEGFDAIRIATPSRPQFLGLTRGDPPTPVALLDDAILINEEGLTILLAAPVDQTEELRVTLSTTLFMVSGILRGEVFGRLEPDLLQVIEEGNATDDFSTDQLQVVSEGNVEDTIADLLVAPRSFTPNGDGRNDELSISYTLYGVIETEIEIGIYTIDGKLVRRFAIDGQYAGANAPVMWNGRDENGELLAPGLYLCQVETETSRGRFASTTPISIAY
jgi:hypothetical protein